MNDQTPRPASPGDPTTPGFTELSRPSYPPPSGPPMDPDASWANPYVTRPMPVQPRGNAAGSTVGGGRRRFAAGIVAASLLVGGGAGLGGAAAYDALRDDPAATGSGTGAEVTSSPVLTSPDEPAADGSVEQVAAAVLPSVVKLDVTDGAGQAGSGSGFIVSSDGVIVTNDHVVAVAGTGGRITVSFSDGSHAEATILGTDPLTDTAVIQAQGVDGLTPATLGESDAVAVG